MSAGHNQDMRLAAPRGICLDRTQTVSFHFDGRRYKGHKGDTIASALAANGVRLISRSFKYHRPRGIMTMAGHDGNVLVQVDDEPNVRADSRQVTEGMNVSAQNVFGSLENDFGRIIELFRRFLPVGFYYKAFYRPRGVWRYWEPLIRHMAGLGKVYQDSLPEYPDKQYRFTDVTVIGGGPAGMSAALAAAELGAEVLLVDENSILGGSLNYSRFTEDRSGIVEVAASLTGRVLQHPGIEVLAGSQCTGRFADNWLSVTNQRRLLKLRSGAVVMATGSYEQPAVFRNNDLPGVMLGSAAQRLIHLYAVKPGHKAVVLTCNDDGYGVALDLLEAGIDVGAVIELRETIPETGLAGAVLAGNVEVLSGSMIREAIPDSGKCSVKGVTTAAIDTGGKKTGVIRQLNCDLVCMSVGYSPAAQLLCQSGGRLVLDEQAAALRLSEPSWDEKVVAAGSLNSISDPDEVMADGRYAGRRAARMAGLDGGAESEPPSQRETANGDAIPQNHPWPIFTHPKGKEFVDFDEDLQVGDIRQAVAEGYDDLELVKRYSTAVMGPSQGRQSALNNLRIALDAAQQPAAGATLTTQRPPVYPETLQSLAGRSFQPLRRTPVHHRHLELGAQMMTAGTWLRPAYYGGQATPGQYIEREALAVRNNVGMIDASTLGKLEIRGPDAADFMNRMYTFIYSRQPINRSRYVLMTDETGAIIDDGVACRLDTDHFYVTATTGGADNVYRRMLHWNARWRLDVDIANVTGAYAAISLAGPNSRRVMEAVGVDIDLSARGFAYMEVRTGHVAGIPARLLRVGFVGELGYEIHVPSGYGEALWDALTEAGKSFDLLPFGVEAQRLLRLEKGHIIIGQDTDGLTWPDEANMAWAVAGKKPFFIGKTGVDILKRQGVTRRLVGFTLPSHGPLPEECNLTLQNDNIAGRVTSVARSKILNKIIGLAYVLPEQDVEGTAFAIKLSDGRRLNAEVAATPFYDPDNKRQEI